MKYILCDIDGTLAKRVTNRSPYDMTRVCEDDLDLAVAETVRAFSDRGYKIIIVSARDESAREDTTLWLNRNEVPFEFIFLRLLGDTRPDDEIKKEIYNNVVDLMDGPPLLVLDDRDKVVWMWRKLGLKCFQVNYGNF